MATLKFSINLLGSVFMSLGYLSRPSRVAASAVVLLTVLGLLTACAKMQWYKDGATGKDFNGDRYTCLRNASQSAPPSTGMGTIDGTLYSYDVNAGNRDQIFNACMEAEGWTLQRTKHSNEEFPSFTPPPAATTPIVPTQLGGNYDDCVKQCHFSSGRLPSEGCETFCRGTQ
jgi:hypothetical protein